MKRQIVILDSGHGGMIGGVYQTPGKRSPDWTYGVLYEGVRNRWLKNKIKEILDRWRIPYYDVSATDRDRSLEKRINMANKFSRDVKKNYDTYFFSLHSNAGGGSGIEVYTYVGESKSDKYATKLINMYESELNTLRVRKDMTDGDPDKESHFYVLKHTMMPAILLESGFMDNKFDYKILWSSNYLEDEAQLISNFIESNYKNGVS